MSRPVLVLDASVGVKWTKRESGSKEARALLDELGAGRIDIVVPAVFPHEVLDVARRIHGPDVARSLWRRIHAAGIVVAGADPALIDETVGVAASLGCTVYDAAAPALAARLGCPLVSADVRAHRRVDGVHLVGHDF